MFGKKEVMQDGPEIVDKPKQKKPLLKKWWFWGIVVLLVLVFMPKGNPSTQPDAVAPPAQSAPPAASGSQPEQAASSQADNTPAAPSVTTGQSNALRAAQNYLDYTAFSYTGLIEQLEFEKYSHEDAVYAADNCGADWNEQAEKCAANYLDFSSFSRDGLIEQLEFDGFTHEQAVHGAEANGY